jgi:EmrB/QacA subfamily drug resistance transporter
MHGMHRHGVTHFDERPAAVESSKGKRRAVLAVVSLALAVVMGMAVSLSVALPDMARNIGATQTQLQWIVNAYAVVFAGLLLPAGALGDRHGRRGVLLAGLLVFGAASAGAVFVDSPGALIALRTASGVGAAMIMPMTLSIVTSVFPPDERAGAVGVWAGVAGAGTFASLLVSGALLEFFSWPSIFALSVVLAALALVGTAALVPTSRDPEHASLDPAGAVLSVAGIAGVVFAIIEGPTLGWASPTVVAAFVVGVLALVAFVLWELRSKRPMLDPRHFLVRPFSAGTLSITMSHVAIFGLLFVALQYLQQILGYSPLVSGLAVLPMVAAFALSPTAAHLSERVGPGPVIAGGLALAAAGLGVLATLGSGSSYWHVLGGFVLTGAGMALSAAPATNAIVAALPQGKQGVASAVNDLSRELGGVLGVAILGSVLNAGYRTGLADAARGVPREALARAQESLVSALGVAGQLGGREGERLADAAREAFVGGLSASLLAGAVVLVVSALGVALLVGPVCNWRALLERRDH